MIDATVDEAYLRYGYAYTHQEIENGLPVIYVPISICVNSETQEILNSSDNWTDVLEKMHSKIGTPGPKIGRSQITAQRSER